MSASNLQGKGGTTGTTLGTQRSTPPEERREGPVARSIENQTSRLPSDLFLWAGLGSIAISLVMQAGGAKERANWVGQWAPTFLILGLYNKLVKVAGSDEVTRRYEKTGSNF